MKDGIELLRRDVTRLRERVAESAGATAGVRPADAQPLRSELFSAEQLALHAAEMATWYTVDMNGGDDRLLPRLSENESILVATFTLVTAAL